MLLTIDEYVDILDGVHLTGVLQDKCIRARVRHTKTEVKLRLMEMWQNVKFSYVLRK